ncbi:MAG: hypothetical protein CSB03_00225 [Bacteroidia bacterium]|nr:MAG: hypothetical protein CSB03_00225 [Bacteroidia bacterium]
MEQNTAKNFFKKEEQEKIVRAIQQAESQTSAEIRLHIDTKTKLTALDRSAYLFKQLDMHKTAARNGVLLYMAIKNKQFAIIGDAGIHQYVKDEFWENCKEEVLAEFKNGNFLKGITECITKVGNALKEHFPRQVGDKNELPDELSFD